MAEELVMNVKSNIKSVTKDTQDWAKSLKEVNEQIKIQEQVIIDLDKDLIKLKAQQDAIPKGAWVAGMDKLNSKIKKTSSELKLEKNALKDLSNQQKEATSEVKKSTSAKKESNKESKESIGNFQLMGVSLNGVKAAFGRVIPMAKAMFGSIKAGLISTGIGAFVVLIGSLVSYFTNTKRGADLLKQAMAGLGAVVSVLTDLFSSVGETIVGAFTDPKKAISDLWEFIKTNLMNRLTGVIDQFKAAGKIIQSAISLDWEGVKEGAEDYGKALIQVGTGLDVEQQKAFLDGIKDIGVEMKKEAAAMSALEKRTQALRDADMEFMIQKAKTRQEIESARLVAEDETKSAKERLDNLKKALELEEKTTKRELELAKERMLIQKQEMLLSENSAEDEQKLAELKTEIIEKETASIKMRRRVVTEVNALEREILAEEKARAKEKQDLIDIEFDAKIKANDEWNKKQISDAKKVADAKIKEANRVAKEEEQITKAVESFKKATIQKGFGAAAAMAGENVALSKGVAAAQVIYNTQQGIMAAMGATSIADKLLPYPLRLANAIATGVMGAAALSTIMSTNPASGGGGGGGGAAGAASGGTPAPQMMSGAFEMTGAVEPEPLRAFVVTDDMTSSQNQLANIRRRATI
tara:strand:- start:45 stop:1961 length:1917 start_codon:yes stop_codon:yes gene_type:complete